MLRTKLNQGKFVVTAELGPPKSADGDVVRRKAQALKGYCDAVNITDNQSSVVRMGSFPASIIAKAEGIEPILQMTTRDRNTMAIQSDILGAYALGLRNVLCLTGDPVSVGNHPNAKEVFEIDGLGLSKILLGLRAGKFANGEDIKTPLTELLIGNTENPFIDTVEKRVDRLEQKIIAGADFFQTQYVFNIERMKQWVEVAGERGLLAKSHIIAGVGPIKSVRMLDRMTENPKMGIDIPQHIQDRIRSSSEAEKVGYELCIEMINELKNMKGIAGVHIMAIEGEAIVKDIVKDSGLI